MGKVVIMSKMCQIKRQGILEVKEGILKGGKALKPGLKDEQDDVKTLFCMSFIG